MFGSVWNFVKRHRRKFIFTGVVIGGITLLGKYAKKKLQEIQDLEAEESLAHARRQHHFDSNQRTCNMTVLSMLPNLRQRLLEVLDTENLTQQLKNKPANKIEIWSELKVLSFTRTLAAVYCGCMLIVFLRVQLNIIGGYMYLDSLADLNGGTSDSYRATPEVQHKYLALVQYLLEQGLEELCHSVQTAVHSQLEEISLKEPLSLSDIQSVIGNVRREVEGHYGNGFVTNTQSNLLRFMMAQETGTDQACSLSPNEVMMSQLTMETRDMLESTDFHCVLNGCLDQGFIRLLDKLAEFFKPSHSDTFANPSKLSMPLAKVIPIMTGLVHTVLADAPNLFIQELLLKEQVKNFAATVYEAFSRPSSTDTPS